MQHSTSTEQRDILNTQNNIEGNPNSNSSQLIVRERIDKTPFYVVGNDEKGYFVTYGKYRLTERCETPRDAQIAIACQEWEQILNVIGVVVKEAIEQNERSKAEKLPSL